MKKYFIITAILAISIIAIFSCRKSVDPEVNPSQMTNPSNATELKIQSFLNRLNSNLKDEKTYSIDSAIWLTEASLNFTYAIYDSALVYVAIDTSEFSLELDEKNKVSESDLETAYNDMVDSLEAYFDGLTVNIKRVFYCDVIEADVAEGRLNLLMVAAVACGYSSYQWSYFDEDDYWYSILEWGKCNYYQGDGDAAIQLTQAFMSNLCVSDPEVRIWFSDEITIGGIDPYYYNYEPAPRDKRGFWYYGSGTMVNPQCCPPEELEFYMSENGIPYIINDQNPDPEELEFESIIIEGDKMNGIGYWVEAHLMKITYGIKHETIIPAASL